MQFDDFYKTIGTFGSYQKSKYLLLCLTNLLPPVMVYAWTFIAATPSFHCKPPFSDLSVSNITTLTASSYVPTALQCRDSQKSISLKECQRCFQSINVSHNAGVRGELRACRSFVFDRTYYQSTLVEDWSMVCDRVSLKSSVQMIFFSGYMVGSLLFGILADKLGRRPVMGVSFILMLISGIICALAPQELFGQGTAYAAYVVGRFLLACATRGIAVTGFVMGSEIVGPNRRLFAGIVIKSFFAFGQLLLLGFALTIRTWQTLNTILAVFPLPFVFFYFILPESPRWLISKERYDEADLLLHHIAERNKKPFDSDSYQQFLVEEKKKMAAMKDHSQGIKAFVSSKVMCIIAINMSYQWFVQNLVFYGISQNTGSWLKNPYIAFGVSGVVEVVACATVYFLLDRCGRRKTYCLFVILLAFVAALVVPIQVFFSKDSQIQFILMLMVNIALKFLASGSYITIYIYSNETFPTQGRNTCMGVCSMVARIGAIIGTYSNDHLTRVWQHFPIVVYGVTSLFAAALATIFPETHNKPLPQTIEDVERMGLAYSFGKSKKLGNGYANGVVNNGEDLLAQKQLKDDVDF